MRRRPPFSEIIPGVLYLGGARKVEILRAAGIRFIVNIARKPYDGRRRRLPLSDGYNAPEKLLAVVACLERRLKRKQVPLYLHCRLGWSRSPVVAAVFLVKRRRFRSFRKALKFVKRVHRPTRPTRGMLASGRATGLILGGKK
jgi:protein-tyrosine phosphatase